MSMFSQSFDLGDNTLQDIENRANERNGLETPNTDLDVIDESPTNKTCSTIFLRSRSRLLRTCRISPLNRSKSDNLLETSRSNKGRSKDLKNNTDSSNIANVNSRIQNQNSINHAKDALQKIENKPTNVDECNFESMFNVSDFSALINDTEKLPDLESSMENCLEKPVSTDDFANLSFNDSDFLRATQEPVAPSELKSPEIIWDDSEDFNNFVIEKPSEVEMNLTANENIALGIDNVTFTQDFLKQPSAADGPNTVDKNEPIEQFIAEEIQSCKEHVKNSLSEDLDYSLTKQKNDFVSYALEKVNDTTNIVLNLSDSIISENQFNEPNQNINEATPLKITETKDRTGIENWGLPSAIVNEYLNKGIKKMFDWQVECLSNKRVLFENCNLVYSAPTSAGKTLVSEILMIKNVLERKKKALIILPFISVVREKMFYLQDLLTPAGIVVEGFFGGYSPPRGFENTQIAVCTIEKANSIVNKLLEQNKIDTIGCIVVDEIHLISDPSRGYILELLLAKIAYVCKKFAYQIQTVTMSATLPNLDLLTRWLKAEFYFTSFRPVELKEMLKIDNQIYDNKLELIRNVEASNDISNLPKDQDHVGHLCMETILEGCSVIVFCPSKDWCESLSHHIAGFIYHIGKSKTETSVQLRKQLNMPQTDEIKSQLRNCSTGLDAVLEKALSYGCAYHHAGLTSDERDIIENGFKIGVIKVIVATSTLSSGVNLPARRVIIRTPLFGGKTMNSLTYKQMIGRAGRTGKDTLGESILICSEASKKSGKDLVCAELLPLRSCLDNDNNIHLKRAMLEIIASGVATTKNDLELFAKCTLLSCDKGFNFKCDDSFLHAFLEQQSGKKGKKKTEVIAEDINDIDDKEDNPIVACLKFLLSYEFIRLQINEENHEINFLPTRLGLACLASSMPPGDGFLLFSELQRSRQCFVLESDLHAIYLVTPFSVCYQMQDIDWLGFLDMWERLPAHMRRVGELIGIKESFLVKAMRNHSLDYKVLQIHKRFYTALALQELVNEQHVTEVAAKFKCSRGLLQTLQQMASTFAGIVTSFCIALNWTMLATIISDFKERLFFGVHRDLIDLMRIPDLNTLRARALFNGGIESLIDLANSSVFQVENILYNSICFDAKKRDGEDDFEANQRNTLRHLYVTGKSGLTVCEAAKLIIDDARRYLEKEIGIEGVNWANDDQKDTEVNGNSVCANTSIKSNLSRNKNNMESEDLFNSNSPENLHKNKRKSNENINLNETVNSKQKRKENSTDVNQKCSLNKLRRSPRIQQKNIKKNNIEPIKEPIENKIPFKHTTQTDVKENNLITKPNAVSTAVSNSFKGNSSRYNARLNRNSTPLPEQIIINLNESDSIGFSASEFNSESAMDIQQMQQNASHILDTTKIEQSAALFSMLNVIDVFGAKDFFTQFIEYMKCQSKIGLSLGIGKFSVAKEMIGTNLFKDSPAKMDSFHEYNCIFDGHFYVAGVCLYLNDSNCYYLNLQNENTCRHISHEMKLDFVLKLLERTDVTLTIFDAKEQLKILHFICRKTIKLNCNLTDPKIAGWLLQPEIELCLVNMAVQYAPECVEIAKLGGRGDYTKGIGLNGHSSVSAKRRSAIECCVSVHILKGQIENLSRFKNGIILKTFEEMEMPIQRSLLLMELKGFPINRDAMVKICQDIDDHIKQLEAKIYQMNGRRFNISSAKEVAKVLGILKNTRSKKISTAKGVLEKIEHPISSLIMQYRKLTTILSKNVQPLLRCIDNDRVHGRSISFTATGRISMHEPNLQNVAKDFQINIGTIQKMISCRSVFQTLSNRNIVSADFCQLELRILSHLSQDPQLLKIMNSKDDVFTLISAKWNRILESEVTEEQRNRTKQICYGIIYGMGIKSLAEVLNCTEDEALKLSESFHKTYSGIRLYIEKILKYVRQEGYVETLAGRRRYFSCINSEDSALRAQNERQAINTIIQGSAADIAKYAILRMERNVQKYEKSLRINVPAKPSSSVDFVLHIHDELIYEVPADKTKQLAKILKSSMENCAKLNVPLRVKVKAGNSWGTLDLLDI